jgi:hypothetical protein
LLHGDGDARPHRTFFFNALLPKTLSLCTGLACFGSHLVARDSFALLRSADLVFPPGGVLGRQGTRSRQAG